MLLISAKIISEIPTHIINLIRYIWEIEFENQEVMFSLERTELDRQRITVYIGEEEINKRVVVSLEDSIQAKITFKKYFNDFVMDLD
jgi:hypothetical protein